MNICEIQDGAVISVPKGIINHFGIVARHPLSGQCTVISNSRKYGKVVEESLESFSNGKPISIVGYPGKLRPNQVIERARSLLNTPYHLIKNNCEHFIRRVHNLKENSPQLIMWIILAFAVIFYIIWKD